MDIVIAGGTGLLGQALALRLVSEFRVYVLSRDVRRATSLFKGTDVLIQDYAGPLPGGALIFNFAGESLGARRLTLKRLDKCLQSRLDCVRHLKALCPAPVALVQGSGYSALLSTDSPLKRFALTLETQCRALMGPVPVTALRPGIILSEDAAITRIFRKLPPLTFIPGTHHVPYVTLEDAVTALCALARNAAVPDFQLPEALTLESTPPLTLNALTARLQGEHRFKLPLPLFLLRKGDLRGALLLNG